MNVYKPIAFDESMLLENKGTNAYAQLRISDVGSVFLFGRKTSSYEKNIKD